MFLSVLTPNNNLRKLGCMHNVDFSIYPIFVMCSLCIITEVHLYSLKGPVYRSRQGVQGMVAIVITYGSPVPPQ